MPQDMTIAKNLRRIMVDKGLSQADLARALDINKAILLRIRAASNRINKGKTPEPL